jgi:thioredoxin
LVIGKLKELVVLGNWDEKAAASSLIQCEGNITAANQLLIDEEITILNNFDIAVKDMIDSGWEEIVARQALLAQWNIDQRKAMGGTVNVSTEVLQSLRPTLHKANETKSSSSVGASDGSKRSSSSSSSTVTATAKNKSSSSAAASSTSSTPAIPKPAKKEDVVFDVTGTNFQKIVLESPIPVLLDIYADWCGPCKQLTPMLEQAAMKSGGMFRLAKLNSDKERSITELLSVTGLPTVFAIDKGRFTDRFVGMLPTDQLQNFLVRLVTGFGDRVQKDDITVAMLDEYTTSITNMIGSSSISFKKKEKLYKLVEEVMNMHDAYQSTSSQDDVNTLFSSQSASSKSNSLSEGVKTALLYINNCKKDIRVSPCMMMMMMMMMLMNMIMMMIVMMIPISYSIPIQMIKQLASPPESSLILHQCHY